MSLKKKLEEDAGFKSSFESLIQKWESLSGGFSKISLENKGQEDYDKRIEACGQVRGRGLLYPYLGSGRGQGCYVELMNGNVIMDFVCGIGVHILGHGHRDIVEASLKSSFADIVMQGNLQFNEEYEALNKKLVELASKNSDLKYSWISPSGAMANENALKMCRQKTGAKKIIVMKEAFAGRTTMMAEITGNATYRQGLPRYDDEVLRIPFYNGSNSKEVLEMFKDYVQKNKGDICAFMFEPMLGEGGYRTAPADFFIPLFEVCREEGIMIWADEVQTFLRSGEVFAFEKLGLGKYIDICTVAKGLQNASTLFTEKLNPKPGLVAGTFSGSSMSLAAGLAIIHFLEKGNYLGSNGRIENIYKKFHSLLTDLMETTCKGKIRDIDGWGLMLGFTAFDGDTQKRNDLLKTLYKNGLMTLGCGMEEARMRFLPPAVCSDEDLEAATKVIEKSILELS